MKDPALAHAANIAAQAGATLWVVDEAAGQVLANVAPRDDLFLLGNRADVIAEAKKLGHNALLNDFDFSQLPPLKWQRVVYRISKEKLVMQHVFSESCKLLAGCGQLVVTGLKDDGGKTAIEKLAKALGTGRCVKERACYCGELDVPADYELYFEVPDYHALELQNVDEKFFLSKPGVYGWQKIDQGSAFLVEVFNNWRGEKSFSSLLDLGCGWGFLTLATARLPIAKRYALDNNISAVIAAEANFESAEVAVEIFCDDALNASSLLTAPVDLVLCNPPFHQGAEVVGGLTTKFLQGAFDSLSSKGSALFVTNSHIGLELKAAEIFPIVEVLDFNRSFKVVRLAKS